jgi:hypothetical protein
MWGIRGCPFVRPIPVLIGCIICAEAHVAGGSWPLWPLKIVLATIFLRPLTD